MPRKSQGWITFQASEAERKILDDYCQRTQRSKTDILRELVRGLEQRDAASDPPPTPFQNEREEQEFLAVQRDFAISARNLLRAKVVAIASNGVSAELTLATGPGVELVAIISQASARRLNLATGQEVYAVIKANSVMIAAIAP
ncbi:MAG: molybdopterin-binding protein [Nodosilinea sp.]